MSSSVQTAQSTVWPEGVLARYLTVGGATVDLTHRMTVHNPPEPFATLALCTGCPASESVSHYYGAGSEANGTYKEVKRAEYATDQARAWAQSHAETCRALPHPTA